LIDIAALMKNMKRDYSSRFFFPCIIFQQKVVFISEEDVCLLWLEQVEQQ